MMISNNVNPSKFVFWKKGSNKTDMQSAFCNDSSFCRVFKKQYQHSRSRATLFKNNNNNGDFAHIFLDLNRKKNVILICRFLLNNTQCFSFKGILHLPDVWGHSNPYTQNRTHSGEAGSMLWKIPLDMKMGCLLPWSAAIQSLNSQKGNDIGLIESSVNLKLFPNNLTEQDDANV